MSYWMNQWINESMNHKPAYRTNPATPFLLTSSEIVLRKSWDILQKVLRKSWLSPGRPLKIPKKNLKKKYLIRKNIFINIFVSFFSSPFFCFVSFVPFVPPFFLGLIWSGLVRYDLVWSETFLFLSEERLRTNKQPTDQI